MSFSSMNSMESVPLDEDRLARVVDNNDPDKKQRIKVTIPGLLVGAVEDLPWILPNQPSLFGFGNNGRFNAEESNGHYGHLYVPRIGSLVTVAFVGGELYYGRVTGSLHVGGVTLSVLETNYPNRYGWVDPAGNHFYVDMTEGSSTLQFMHRSGTVFNITDTGSVDIKIVENETKDVTGNVTVTVGGNVSVDVTGTANVTTGGDATVSVGGNLSADVAASATLQVGGSFSGTAASWSFTGPVSMSNTLAVAGPLAAAGGAAVSGSMTNNGVNVGNSHYHGNGNDGNPTTSVIG